MTRPAPPIAAVRSAAGEAVPSRLTSLAPDITEAILRGEELDGLSLEKLRKNLPVRWDEQMKCWMKS